MIRRLANRAALALVLGAASTVPVAAAEVAPVKAAPTASGADYTFEEVRANLHVLRGAGGNVAVWSGPDGIVLVDDGTVAMGAKLLEAVQQVARGPIRFVIDTQWRPEHTGGNEAVARAGALVIAQEATRERMSQPQSFEDPEQKIPAAPAAALPELTFVDSIALHLGGERLDVVHVADAHSDGDVIVRWQAADVVHMGDLYDNSGYPGIDLEHGGSLAGMVAAIEGTLARSSDQTVIIPGHGPLSNRAELAAYRDMLVAVGRTVREAVEQGRSLDEVLESRPTAAYDERYGRGAVSAERFVRTLYRGLAGSRAPLKSTGRN